MWRSVASAAAAAPPAPAPALQLEGSFLAAKRVPSLLLLLLLLMLLLLLLLQGRAAWWNCATAQQVTVRGEIMACTNYNMYTPSPF